VQLEIWPPASVLIALSLLAGCAADKPLHAGLVDNGHTLPPVSGVGLDQKFLKQTVTFGSDLKPGTIVVDTREKFLYLVQGGGQAIRYGIAVGDEAHAWTGRAKVTAKRPWPTWTPTADMIRRNPRLASYTTGMKPSVMNPLGARALYLAGADGDRGYRIHGTPEWTSIGRAKSSGCIRLVNQDVIDLYDRVEVGAEVIVR